MLTQIDIAINNMSRDEIVTVLETQGGYQCYDHESITDLREVLRTDIEQGILSEAVLPS